MVLKTEWVELPMDHIADIQPAPIPWYPQLHGNYDEEARKTETYKYHQRIRQILKNQLDGKYKIHAINMYALLVIRYPVGLVSWPKQDMKAADVKTWKLLTSYGGFNPKFTFKRM